MPARRRNIRLSEKAAYIVDQLKKEDTLNGRKGRHKFKLSDFVSRELEDQYGHLLKD